MFEKIYKIYRPKFDRLSYRMNNEDITQELSIALLKAVRTFKTGMPAKFNTYFCARLLECKERIPLDICILPLLI